MTQDPFSLLVLTGSAFRFSIPLFVKLVDALFINSMLKLESKGAVKAVSGIRLLNAFDKFNLGTISAALGTLGHNKPFRRG